LRQREYLTKKKGRVGDEKAYHPQPCDKMHPHIKNKSTLPSKRERERWISIKLNID